MRIPSRPTCFRSIGSRMPPRRSARSTTANPSTPARSRWPRGFRVSASPSRRSRATRSARLPSAGSRSTSTSIAARSSMRYAVATSTWSPRPASRLILRGPSIGSPMERSCRPSTSSRSPSKCSATARGSPIPSFARRSSSRSTGASSPRASSKAGRSSRGPSSFRRAGPRPMSARSPRSIANARTRSWAARGTGAGRSASSSAAQTASR